MVGHQGLEPCLCPVKSRVVCQLTECPKMAGSTGPAPASSGVTGRRIDSFYFDPKMVEEVGFHPLGPCGPGSPKKSGVSELRVQEPLISSGLPILVLFHPMCLCA